MKSDGTMANELRLAAWLMPHPMDGTGAQAPPSLPPAPAL